MSNLYISSQHDHDQPQNWQRHHDLLHGDEPFTRHDSQEDVSINWVARAPKHGFLEARYVRRADNYFVIYLSSQSGCAQRCRFCHLTATKQTKFEHATVSDLVRQAQVVYEHYDSAAPAAKKVHYNFMARGEPLDNPHIVERGDELLLQLAELANRRRLFPKHLISTIMPKSFGDRSLTDSFRIIHPEIYYSLYSMEPEFRDKWLPNAMAPEVALAKLREWQDATAKIPKIHYTFIQDENDSLSTVERICEAVNDFGLRVNVNIIRYNPFSEEYGREPPYDVIQRNAKAFSQRLPNARVQVVTRVGYDVNAACGMFVE